MTAVALGFQQVFDPPRRRGDHPRGRVHRAARRPVGRARRRTTPTVGGPDQGSTSDPVALDRPELRSPKSVTPPAHTRRMVTALLAALVAAAVVGALAVVLVARITRAQLDRQLAAEARLAQADGRDVAMHHTLAELGHGSSGSATPSPDLREDRAGQHGQLLERVGRGAPGHRGAAHHHRGPAAGPRQPAGPGPVGRAHGRRRAAGRRHGRGRQLREAAHPARRHPARRHLPAARRPACSTWT